ncbi:MAG: PGF-pre-PGF domain-containing protein, partial [Deltaproteobacteria bacterium]|nr:PGF-pre-PGF domain-containing protein [Deltaproteobacteria bacterium]
DVDNEINLTKDQALYQYINITTVNIPEGGIKNVTMDFCVDYDWLNNKSVLKDTIKLKRLYNGAWQTQITAKVSDDGKEVCYISQIPGFSYFVITGDIIFIQPLQNETDIIDNETIPQQDIEKDDNETFILPEGAVCYPKERACVGWNVLQQCNNYGTGWVTVTDCFYGCNNAQCNTNLVISIDYSIFWAVIGMIAVLLVIWVVHSKKRAIENFFFWKL